MVSVVVIFLGENEITTLTTIIEVRIISNHSILDVTMIPIYR